MSDRAEIQRLTRLQDEIKTQQDELNRLKGKKDALMDQLKALGISGIKAAKKKVKDLERRAEGLEDEASKKLHDLMEEAEWS